MDTELTNAMRKKHNWNIIDYDNPVNMPPLNTPVHILIEQDNCHDEVEEFDAPVVAYDVILVEIDPKNNFGATRKWMPYQGSEEDHSHLHESVISQSETVVAWRLKI